MKVLIISDIHSNIDALKAVWEAESDSDAVLCAGDLVDWGFYAHEVVQWFRQHHFLAVSGNHDRYILELYRNSLPAPEGSFAELNLNALTPDDMAYLAGLPEKRTVQIDGVHYYICHTYCEEDMHAVKKSIIQHASMPLFEDIWLKEAGQTKDLKRCIVFGHSHQCCMYMVRRNSWFINPGSVSYRVCADSEVKGADYIVVQDGEFFMRHIDYPTGHLRKMVGSSALNSDAKRQANIYFGSDID